ncbi:MepB family protein [Streptomyces sp. NBC_00299]|uniref:MepB family protein n=1 Tax=Streptomyces sp. NBC_00299 TaxID=2975705 RepID=UPI002E2A7965|nr:MepB family protein [Streptomyces sp. NBC_00299]
MTTPAHSDLAAAKEFVYDPCGFTCSQPVPEPESAEYAAHAFTLDGLSVRFRAARTTPTKVGQFVFAKDVLRRRGVVSVDGSGGKRAFRVYPPWVTTTNRQATSTQAWQLDHFLPLDQAGPVDSARARKLYHP